MGQHKQALTTQKAGGGGQMHPKPAALLGFTVCASRVEGIRGLGFGGFGILFGFLGLL